MSNIFLILARKFTMFMLTHSASSNVNKYNETKCTSKCTLTKIINYVMLIVSSC